MTRVRSHQTVAVLIALALLLTACGTSPGTDTGGGDGDPAATALDVSSSYLSFPGTSAESLQLTADGTWSVETAQDEWLRVSPDSGDGDATLEVTVDRSDLEPGAFAGSLLFRGGSEPLAAVTVAMRFPRVFGTIGDGGGRISAAASLRTPHTNDVRALEAGRDYVPNELLVAVDETMARAVREGRGRLATAALRETDVRAVARSVADDHGLELVRALPGAGTLALLRTERPLEEAMAALRADGRVRDVEPHYLLERAYVPDDPLYADQEWHYGMIDLPAAWDVSQGEDDVVVAVVDGSFDTLHPDLAPNLLPGYDFADGDDDVGDPDAHCGTHGTHVAGTVAAVGDNGAGVTGVAPRVKVLPLKIGLEQDGCPLSLVGAMDAIAYAAGLGDADGAYRTPVDVINLSLGGASYSFAFEEVIGLVVGHGVTVVAAAGNHRSGESDAVMYPAAHAPAIAVGAVDAERVLATYSNVGPELDVVAPGGTGTRGVVSTVSGGGYGASQGTSMSTPHVAGLVALMRSTNRGLDPSLITLMLRATAADLGIDGPDTEYGHGLVDAGAAVLAAQDELTARYGDLHVRIEPLDGGDVREVRPDGAGAFAFEGLAAGVYKLVAGSDVDADGVLGEGGEFYGERSVAVDYHGDQELVLELEPQ